MIVKAEYFAVSFFSRIVYPTADATANIRNPMPAGEPVIEKSLFNNMIIMPENEMMIPMILINGNFSFKVKCATSGVNKGMVAMITALMVGVEYFNPKFSPRKYRKGLKRDDSRNNLRSDRLIISVLPRILRLPYNKRDDNMSLRKMVVIGS
jgi:hypothetical protein